jgi:hypothetical protein
MTIIKEVRQVLKAEKYAFLRNSNILIKILLNALARVAFVLTTYDLKVD